MWGTSPIYSSLIYYSAWEHYKKIAVTDDNLSQTASIAFNTLRNLCKDSEVVSDKSESGNITYGYNWSRRYKKFHAEFYTPSSREETKFLWDGFEAGFNSRYQAPNKKN